MASNSSVSFFLVFLCCLFLLEIVTSSSSVIPPHPVKGKKFGQTKTSPFSKTSTFPELDENIEENQDNQNNQNILNESPQIDASTQFIAECDMPTIFGKFRMRSYRHISPNSQFEPLVIMSGNINKDNVIVRVHDQCATSEVFGSLRCDCREQLHNALRLIKKEGGIVIYLQQEGRGIGIANKIAAYSLQDKGFDTVDANLHLGFKSELREYTAVANILKDMGIKSIRLITNNPFKIDQLDKLGITINNRISINTPANRYNLGYLKSKRDRMQHMLSTTLSSEIVSSNLESKQQNTPEKPSNSASTNSAATVSETTPFQIDESVIKSIKNTSYVFGAKSVEDAIEAVRNGKIVLVVDDESRENEGDLIMAAQHATAQTIGFIVRHSSGVLCASLESNRLDELQLPPMVINNEDPKQTAYTVSVDCRHNTTTGISGADRAMTFKYLADPKAVPHDFTRPGHVFPLRYRQGGVLVRGGHTEASVDLCKLAGLESVAVLAEVVHDDGSMMRLEELKKMAIDKKLVLTSVQDLIAYRIELRKKGQDIV